ncbi:hypothetical protein BBJ28_00011128 [Nothophytophthora sp. Chile5]|nr:hypothetical protein BBJ28_00011128 [Nothophytophthora sp. Chile5]
MQRFIRLTAAEAEAAMKPALVDGKWKQPAISGRKIALVKKHALRNGLVGAWVEGQGGWLETWDRPQKHHVMRPLKGHKNQRNEFDRCVLHLSIYLLLNVGTGGLALSLFVCDRCSVKKVQAALANMPAKIAEHKKAMKQSKPLKGLDKWLNETDPY